MMPKIEYDNLYKFITSLGCIIMASAFILPWIFTQSTAILLIENSKIEALPPISKGILNDRLDKIYFIENLLPFISSLLLVIGLFIFIYGALGWNEAYSKVP